MKKCSLLLLFWSIVFCSIAQTEVPQTNFVTKSNPDEWKTTLNRHEFSIGWGDELWTQWWIYPSWLFKADDWCPSPMERYNPKTWFDDDTYSGIVWTLGTQSFSYAFRVKKWFWVGVDVAYTGWYNKIYDAFTDEVVGHENVHLFSIMPKIRFSYLNRKHVMLYSGFSLGFGIETNHYDESVYGHLAGQLTTFGVKAGSNWFGFAEIGFGYKGFGTIGVGYHFNTQRNKSLNGLTNK